MWAQVSQSIVINLCHMSLSSAEFICKFDEQVAAVAAAASEEQVESDT